VRSLLNLQKVDPGFRPQRTLTARVRLPDRTPDSRQRAFYDELQKRLAALPGVTAAREIKSLFEIDPPRSLDLRAVAGRELAPKRNLPLVWTTVSGDYFPRWAFAW
jgi:hypothetical protein